MKLNKLLKSPILLYFLLTVVILNILYLLQTQNTRSLVIFILIGLVTYTIKENLIIVFIVSLVLTNCLFNKKNNFMEGMETQKDEENVDGVEENTDDKPKKISEEKKNDDEPIMIDEAKTIESSYENLQKFLDSPGFNKLTNETQKLAKSQDRLMKSLSTLTPILSDAKASIGNLDLSTYGSLSDIINNLGKK